MNKSVIKGTIVKHVIPDPGKAMIKNIGITTRMRFDPVSHTAAVFQITFSVPEETAI